MNIAIVGTGTMGRLTRELVSQNPSVDRIWSIEPLAGETLWDIEKSLGKNPSGVGFVQGDSARRARQECGKDSGVDVVIDFSHPKTLPMIEDYLIEKKGMTGLVIATTGYSNSEEEKIRALAQRVPLLKSSNYSYGINTVRKILKEMTPLLEPMSDIEIIEKHHNKKIDSPSGTASMLADAVDPGRKRERLCGRNGEQKRGTEIGIHSMRGGTIFGEHTVIFAMEDEVVEIRHTAFSKTIFAKGAMDAALWLCGREPGYYTFDKIFS